MMMIVGVEGSGGDWFRLWWWLSAMAKGQMEGC